MNIKRFAIVLLLALAGLSFSGCRHFEAKPLDASDNLKRLEQRSLADAGLRSFVKTNLHKTLPSWPLESWDFQTLTLVALYFSPELEMAMAKCAEAKAAKVTAGERPNPSIGFSPGYNTSTPAGDISPWIFGLNLDVPIETAGKRGHRLSQARHISDAAEFGIAVSAWDVRAKLKRAMIALWSAREQESLAKQKLSAIEELDRISTDQFKVGEIGREELMRLQMIMQQARIECSNSSGKASKALADLAGAAGLAPHALDGVKIDFSGFEQSPHEIPSSDVRRKALLNRADVLSALSEYAASESVLRLEIAKQYPDLNLNPGYEFDQGDDKWHIGFQLTVPLLSRNRGPIAEAEAKRKTAAARFNSLQSKVLGEIETAAITFQTEREKLASADSMLEKSQKQTELIRNQYNTGEVSKMVEVLSRVENVTAALMRLDSQVNTQESLSVLERSLETPLDATLMPTVSISTEVK